MMARFFAYDPGCGFQEYETGMEAHNAAKSAIDEYRNEAGMEWPEDVEHVCWGEIRGRSTATYSTDSNYVDYVLRDAR